MPYKLTDPSPVGVGCARFRILAPSVPACDGIGGTPGQQRRQPRTAVQICIIDENTNPSSWVVEVVSARSVPKRVLMRGRALFVPAVKGVHTSWPKSEEDTPPVRLEPLQTCHIWEF